MPESCNQWRNKTAAANFEKSSRLLRYPETWQIPFRIDCPQGTRLNTVFTPSHPDATTERGAQAESIPRRFQQLGLLFCNCQFFSVFENTPHIRNAPQECSSLSLHSSRSINVLPESFLLKELPNLRRQNRKLRGQLTCSAFVVRKYPILLASLRPGIL